MMIKQDSEKSFVVMDVSAFNRWREAMALMKLLSLSEADVATGRLVSTDEAFERARNAIG